eukprot:scaffold86814_cov16-Tisochrysis_lutea.AAC.1
MQSSTGQAFRMIKEKACSSMSQSLHLPHAALLELVLTDFSHFPPPLHKDWNRHLQYSFCLHSNAP